MTRRSAGNRLSRFAALCAGLACFAGRGGERTAGYRHVGGVRTPWELGHVRGRAGGAAVGARSLRPVLRGAGMSPRWPRTAGSARRRALVWGQPPELARRRDCASVPPGRSRAPAPLLGSAPDARLRASRASSSTLCSPADARPGPSRAAAPARAIARVARSRSRGVEPAPAAGPRRGRDAEPTRPSAASGETYQPLAELGVVIEHQPPPHPLDPERDRAPMGSARHPRAGTRPCARRRGRQSTPALRTAPRI